MRRIYTLLILVAALVQFTFADDPVITVTNQNLAFIRESRSLAIKKGMNSYTITDLPEFIDPGSCQFTSEHFDFRIIDKVFNHDLSDLNSMLNRAVKTNVTVISEQGTIRGILEAFDGGYLFIETSDGVLHAVTRSVLTDLTFDDIGQNYAKYPTLRIQADATAAGTKDIIISYLTQGLDWEAIYSAFQDEEASTIDLSAEVAVSNRSGKSFSQAQLRLLAGELHEAPAYQAPRMHKRMEEAITLAAVPGEATPLSEFKIFDMPRRTDLPDQETRFIRFLDPVRIKVNKQYIFDNAVDPQGINVSLVAINDKSSGVGIPLPAGTLRVYQTNAQTEYIGADRLSHTAVDEKITIRIGKAFDLKAERKVLEQKRISNRSEQMTVQVELRNHKEDDVEIMVSEPIPYYRSYEIIKSSHPLTEQEARKVNFKIAVPAKGTTTLTFTLLFTW